MEESYGVAPQALVGRPRVDGMGYAAPQGTARRPGPACEWMCTMKYQLVIFDFDGTLADSFPWFVRAANTLAAHYHFTPIAPDEVELLRRAGPRQVVRHLGMRWWQMPLIARRLRSLTAANLDQIALFDGVDQMLARLTCAGVTLALVTSNTAANARYVLGMANAARMTDYECRVGLFGKAARFRRLVHRHGLRPQDALCVGDELRDLEAARQAQIPFGAVGWGFTPLPVLQAHAPAEVFVRMEEIAERLA